MCSCETPICVIMLLVIHLTTASLTKRSQQHATKVQADTNDSKSTTKPTRTHEVPTLINVSPPDGHTHWRLLLRAVFATDTLPLERIYILPMPWVMHTSHHSVESLRLVLSRPRPRMHLLVSRPYKHTRISILFIPPSPYTLHKFEKSVKRACSSQES